MGRTLIAAVLAGAALSAAMADEPRSIPLKVGETAPNFSLRDQEGNVVTLSKQRGSKVVLVFYRGYW